MHQWTLLGTLWQSVHTVSSEGKSGWAQLGAGCLLGISPVPLPREIPQIFHRKGPYSRISHYFRVRDSPPPWAPVGPLRLSPY